MKIDNSNWDQPALNYSTKRRRGRPSKGDKALVFKTLGLTQEQWEWVSLWMPGGSPTAQARELLERAIKFWPAGPAKFR